MPARPGEPTSERATSPSSGGCAPLPGENRPTTTAATRTTAGSPATSSSTATSSATGTTGLRRVPVQGGRVAFGVGVGSNGNTICGTTDVTDGAWHHVAVTRRFSDGRLRCTSTGVLDADGPGRPTGTASYRNGRTTSYPNSDPFLVIGAEKHDAGTGLPVLQRVDRRDPALHRLAIHGRGFTRAVQSLHDATATPPPSITSTKAPATSSGTPRAANSHGTRLLRGQSRRARSGRATAPPLTPPGAPRSSRSISGLARPVAIANAGDGRLFVVEADGRILAYEVTEDGPFNFLGTFLDIQDRVLCSRGARAPRSGLPPELRGRTATSTSTTRRNAPTATSSIARFRRPRPAASEQWRRSEHREYPPDHRRTRRTATTTAAGWPSAPMATCTWPSVTAGAAGIPSRAARTSATLLGKVLRLAVDRLRWPGALLHDPAEQPVRRHAGDPLDEIWAWGLRNPWRIAFDRLTGDLFIADVGQGKREEVNFQPRRQRRRRELRLAAHGRNRLLRPAGLPDRRSLVPPILDYGHGEGCSVTGGYRYRGSQVPDPPWRVPVRRLLQRDDLGRRPGVRRDLEPGRAPRLRP